MRGENETRGTFEWYWSAWNGDFRAADAETAHHRVIRSRCIGHLDKLLIAGVLVRARTPSKTIALSGRCRSIFVLQEILRTSHQIFGLNQGYAYSDLTQERSWTCASDHNCRVSTRFCSGYEIVSEVKQRWQRHVVWLPSHLECLS
jgi:hypothetical protein